MTVYLCTCGTSAAKNLIPQGERFDAQWVESHQGADKAARQLLQTFRDYPMTDDTARRAYLSAEIHSLARMGAAADDRVVLFTSETPDGRACAIAVQLYLQEQLPGLICEVAVIQGLQVQDAAAFRTQGVVNFTKEVLKRIEDYGAGQCVLNPTGGFKSLVPYTVLIGMIKQVEARYIFEQSTALIRLPMMPVEFSRQRLEPIRALLERIDRETFIPKVDWEKAIPYEQREGIASLFEFEGKEVTLSSVGLLIWEELRKPSALVPFLSRVALEDYIKLRGIENSTPQPFLERVCRDQSQLETAKHESWSNGLFWLKRGQHTRDRYLVSVEDWRLLVWRMVDHDEYDRLLQNNREGDQGKRIAEERKNRHEPFLRMEFYEGER